MVNVGVSVFFFRLNTAGKLCEWLNDGRLCGLINTGKCGVISNLITSVLSTPGFP